MLSLEGVYRVKLFEGQIMEVEGVMVAAAVGGGRLAVCVQEGRTVEEVGVGDELFEFSSVRHSVGSESGIGRGGREVGSGREREGPKDSTTPVPTRRAKTGRME